MKRIWAIILPVIALPLLLTGCGNNVANEKRIQDDLAAYDGFLNDGEEIESIEIEKRQTEKDEKNDTIWCVVTTKDADCSYQKSAVLGYTLYDSGWLLDDVSVNSRKEWIILPLGGIKEEDLPASLKNEAIVINGEPWKIVPKDISVTQQNTDLEGKTDKITTQVVIEDTVQRAEGELTLTYIFDDGWKIDTISGDESFAVSTIEGKELNISEENIVEELSGEEYQYGIPENATVYFTSDLQTVTFNKDELSDLVIDNIEITSKGTQQTYTCHCILTKPHAEFAVNATLAYRYTNSDGWTLDSCTITLKCTSVSIQGDWSGTYSGVGSNNGQAVLSITDVSTDGTITGIYSYTPNTASTYSQAGSYYVSGSIDFYTMLIKLEAGEWINEPAKHLSVEKADVLARLYADSSQILGNGHRGNTFKLSQ